MLNQSIETAKQNQPIIGYNNDTLRKRYNLFLNEYIYSIRRSFESSDSKYKFIDSKKEFCFSEKTYFFAKKIKDSLVNLYDVCEKNKENESYWKELAVGILGIYGAMNTDKESIKMLSGAAAAGAVFLAGKKAKSAADRQKSAIAFTKIFNHPDKLENLSISLGVSLAYRFGNIINILDGNDNIKKLVDVFSCQIGDYILDNDRELGSLENLHGLLLKATATIEYQKGNTIFDFFRKIFGRDGNFVKVSESSNEWDLRELLRKSPAYDEVGTIYYKKNENEDPFQYPFQKLIGPEDAMDNSFEKFLDITECWESILGDSSFEKLHSGSDRFDDVPRKLYSEIYDFREKILISKRTVFSGETPSINSSIELFKKLKDYIDFCCKLSISRTNYQDSYFTNLINDLNTGKTSTIHGVMLLQNAFSLAEGIDKEFSNNIYTKIMLSQKRFMQDINRKNLIDTMGKFKESLSALRQILTKYKDIYVSGVKLRALAIQANIIEVSGNFVHPTQNPVQPQVSIAIVNNGDFLSWIGHIFNPANLNKNANNILDCCGIRDENLRLLLKAGGGVLVACAASSMAYWFWPTTIKGAKVGLFEIKKGAAVKVAIVGVGTFFVVSAAVNALLEYQIEVKRHHRLIQQWNNQSNDIEKAEKNPSYAKKVNDLELHVAQLENGVEKISHEKFLKGCKHPGADTIPYFSEGLEERLERFRNNPKKPGFETGSSSSSEAPMFYSTKIEGVHKTMSAYPIFGLKYEPVDGNGHCLFAAVGRHVDQDQDFLRKEVTKNIEHNMEEYRNIIQALNPQKTPEKYIEDLREGIEWADNLEIAILMKILDRPIVIVDPDINIRNLSDLIGNGAPIFVQYNGHNHYDALILTGEKTAAQLFETITKSIKHPPKISGDTGNNLTLFFSNGTKNNVPKALPENVQTVSSDKKLNAAQTLEKKLIHLEPIRK